MTDPADLPPARWQSRLAALKSNGASDDDHRVVECLTALSYWRVRRVVDSERGRLAPEHVAALADMLRHAHRAVPA
ncbi:MAG: hypothetical protein ACPGVG_09505 [Mycobacterium sp.]